MKDNNDYIDIMEEYFNFASNKKDQSGDLKDARPEQHYLVGVTPDQKEKARRHNKKIETLTEENKPVSPLNPVYDAKWRFYW